MEKINVAELLKDCPKGMELNCTMYDNLYFDSLNADYHGTINCYTLIDGIKTSINFTKYGTFNNHIGAKCVIFPKGKTTWEGFVPYCNFKDGDVVACNCSDGNSQLFIFKEYDNNGGTVCYLFLDTDGSLDIDDFAWEIDRLATEEEKTKLFQAIKDNGYKWNAETKTLEELVESKEDTENKTVMAGIYFDREYYADEVELHLGNYEIEIRDGKTYAVFKNQETKILKPIFKVGDKIKRKGETRLTTIKDIRDNYYIITIPDFFDNAYITDKLLFSNQNEYEIIPNKFDITILKPFESKVLVRTKNFHDKWTAGFFSHIDSDYEFAPFWTTADQNYQQCIPYEGNEHLLGTTDDCDEYFKTWK